MIERLGIHGEGIGSLDGYTLFVDGALPGESVSVELTQKRKTYAKAKVLSFLSQSEDREVPICPVFQRCGGCQLMHLEYEKQLLFKQKLVIDALQRIGKLTDVPVDPCLPSPKELSYRNKIQLPARLGQNGIELGLFARESHDLIPVSSCHIHSTLGEKVFSHLSNALKNSQLTCWDPKTQKGELRHVLIKTAVHTGQVLILFVTSKSPTKPLYTLAAALKKEIAEVKGVVHNLQNKPTNAVLGPHFTTLEGEGAIYETLLGLSFKVSPASFFQVNPWQVENLYSIAIDELALTPKDRILDAYCGVGTLALIAAKNAKEVIGIESVPQAIEDAKANAALNGIQNATFIAGNVENKIHQIGKVDACLINPPRKGCETPFLDVILKLSSKRIVYISCDPATLARDLKHLSTRYFIKRCKPLDMFPQTAHVETVATLELR